MCRVCHSVYMSKTFNSPPLLLAMAAWWLIAPAPLSPIFVISSVFSTNLVSKINQHHTMQSSIPLTFQLLHPSVWLWYKITGICMLKEASSLFITLNEHDEGDIQLPREMKKYPTVNNGLYKPKCSNQIIKLHIIPSISSKLRRNYGSSRMLYSSFEIWTLIWTSQLSAAY